MSGLKLFRLFSLLLCLLVCLASFSVVANAAESNNLVESDLTKWTIQGVFDDTVSSVEYIGNGVFMFTADSPSENATLSMLIDDTEPLVSGKSYTFSFTIPRYYELGSSDDSESTYLNALSNGFLNVEVIFPDTETYITYDLDSYEDFQNAVGKPITLSFVCPDYIGTPIVLFYIGCDDSGTETAGIFLKDVSLYSDYDIRGDMGEVKEGLSGIKEWLHNIYYGIVGGECDYPEHQHSSLADKIKDLGTSISTGFSNLKDNISSSFSDLGSNLESWFSNVGDWFTTLTANISTWFNDLKENIKTFFEELPGKIFNFSYDGNNTGESHLIDLKDFTFECTSCPGVNPIVYNSDGSVFVTCCGRHRFCKLSNANKQINLKANKEYILYFKFTNFQSTSTYFVDDSKIKIYLDGKLNKTISYAAGEGTYLYTFTPQKDCSFYVDIEIPAYYSFLITDYNLYWGTEPVSWYQNLINKFTDWFDNLRNSIQNFFIKLVDDIKGLFIPPEGFFEEWKVTFDLMLSDNLGFIYQAPNFVINIVEVVQEILQSDQEVNLVFPAVEFDIAGYDIELFKDTKVDFSFLEAGIWLTLYSMYKVMLYVIFALALIKYGMSTWERTMAN